jgi:hypothetical protein
MPRVPSEEVQLLQVRVAVGPAAELKKEADHAKRPVSHLCKLILEDHVNMFGLPNALKDVLEADRKSHKQDMREYMRTILVERYDKLVQARKK